MLRVLFIFAHFLGVLSLTFVLPALAAYMAGEAELVASFVITGVLGLFVSGSLVLGLRGREQRLRRHERYLLAAILFVGLPVFAAIPIALAVPQTPAIDAYFEAVSALTTTGSSVLARNEQLPVAILFWRCLLQWIGGGLSLLVAVIVLGPAGVGGLPPTDMRIAEHGRVSEQNRLYETLSRLLPVYLFATLLCFTALVMTGTPSFDALGLSFAALSTGGFTIRSSDFAEYVPLGATWIFAIFMLVGATNILWQRAIAERKWRTVRANRETVWLFALAAGIGLLIAANLFRLGGDTLLRSLTDGFFTAASLISTTGVESRTGSF
ncbi:MAG: potassium transporter TrkG, partial [Flavobacteriaceae bacterium]